MTTYTFTGETRIGKNSSNNNRTTASTPTYINTNTTNPYYQTTTNKDGTTTNNFVAGTAGQKTYDFVNENISGLLNNYLNPSLNNTTDQAKIREFNKQQQSDLQNNIINPLSANNMVRSSQATNMYKNLSNQSADYTNQLLAESQDNTWNMINNLMNLYATGYQGASGDVSTALGSAVGSNSKTTSKSG